MCALSSGTKKTKGTTLHLELADKVLRMENYLYLAMEHCSADEETRRQHLQAAIEYSFRCDATAAIILLLHCLCKADLSLLLAKYNFRSEMLFCLRLSLLW